jgi:tetratricopeptide (TPR) repeat protein
MRLHAKAGQRAAALRQYQTCVEVLQRELGVEPEPETRKIYRELLPRRLESDGATADDDRQGVGTDPPLVGREAERKRIVELASAARQRRGHVLAIVGEAGVGKTRLVNEAMAIVRAAGGRTIVGRAFESARVLPYGPWVDALHAGLTMDREAVMGLDPAWKSQLTWLLPELGGTSSPAASGTATQLFAAVVRLLERWVANQPLLVVLEDAHWADEPTLRLVAHVARQVSRWPVLLMITARTEEMGDNAFLSATLAELRQYCGLDTIALSLLSRDETRTLTRSLSKAKRNDSGRLALDEQAWQGSQGNPLIIVEMVREFLEHPATPARASEFPRRVRDLFSARLDRLSARARQVVSIASVIGRECEFRLLQHCAALEDRPAAEVVEELVRRRILHGVGDRLDFHHDWLRRIARDRLIAPQAAAIHRAVAASTEVVYAGRLEQHYGALADHYQAGEVWDKALGYWIKAGQYAAERVAYGDAVVAFERALEIADRLPRSPAILEQIVDTRLELHTAYYALGEVAHSHRALEGCEAAVTVLGDARRQAWVTLHTGQYLWVSGHARAALPLFDDAAAFARRSDELGLLLSATMYMATARLNLGDFKNSELLYQSLIDRLMTDSGKDRFGLHGVPTVFAYTGLAAIAAEQGRFAEARAHAEAGRAAAEVAGQPYSLMFAARIMGHVCTLEGRLNDAIEALSRCAAFYGDPTVKSLVPNVMAALGYARALAGQPKDGVEGLTEALRLLASYGQRAWYVVLLSELSEACLLAGDDLRARETATEALDLARTRGEQAFEGWALRALAAAISELPDGDRAIEPYAAALAIARKLDMRPLQARCHLGMAEVYARIGQRGRARQERSAAREIADAIGMTLRPGVGGAPRR